MSDVATALSLMRRLPPNKIEQNLSGMLNLLPEETDELLQRIDQPLQEAVCPDTVSYFAEKSHLTCIFSILIIALLICPFLLFLVC